jgi:hypothetical protein
MKSASHDFRRDSNLAPPNTSLDTCGYDSQVDKEDGVHTEQMRARFKQKSKF